MLGDPISSNGLSGARVLVTGADGFIGSHLVERLLAEGAKVRALCCYNSNGSRGWLDDVDDDGADGLETVLGDIRDAGLVRSLTDGIDIVFHLAALIAIPYSYQAPASFIETNVTGTLNVLEAVRQSGVERMIQTSTSEVYGTPREVPITETHPLCGQSPYAASKIAADQLCEAYARSYSTPVVILRPFNTYGPRQSARAVIPTIITQILSGRREINLGSLTPTRDFNYVEDTCRGMLALAGCKRAIGETVNIGSNFEISIGDMAGLIQEILDTRVTIVTDAARVRPAQSEVERLCCDNAKIFALTGFRPQVALKEGLTRTIAWLKRPENLARSKAEIYNV